MKLEESIRVGSLAAAFALSAVVLMAAPSARAQFGLPDDLPENADELACQLYADLIENGNAFCVEAGCEPTPKDCEKLCKNASKTCKGIGGSVADLVKDAVKAVSKDAKRLCATADDKKDCKGDVKDVDKLVKAALKEFKKDLGDACKDESFGNECEDACDQGLDCSCDGDELICVSNG